MCHPIPWPGLSDFALSRDFNLRPVRSNEVRMLHQELGVFVLYNLLTDQWVVEMPVVLLQLALLTWVLDQCSIGYSSAFFLTQEMRLALLLLNDLYHRDWNDVRLALRRAPGFFWISG